MRVRPPRVPPTARHADPTSTRSERPRQHGASLLVIARAWAPALDERPRHARSLRPAHVSLPLLGNGSIRSRHALVSAAADADSSRTRRGRRSRTNRTHEHLPNTRDDSSTPRSVAQLEAHPALTRGGEGSIPSGPTAASNDAARRRARALWLATPSPAPGSSSWQDTGL